MKHNKLGDGIPVIIYLKTMGVESDLEMIHLVYSSELEIVDCSVLSMEEPVKWGGAVCPQQSNLAY